MRGSPPRSPKGRNAESNPQIIRGVRRNQRVEKDVHVSDDDGTTKLVPRSCCAGRVPQIGQNLDNAVHMLVKFEVENCSNIVELG